MKHKKSALFKSLISLLLCFSMLIGTTFAWFADSVVTGMNTIAAGNLDVELYHSNAVVTDEQVETSTKLFMDLQGDPILWEPGVVSYENLRVTNAGDLALAYQLAINTANENFVVDETGAQYGLSQVLKVGVVEGGITATDRAGVVASVEDANWTTLANFLRSGSLLPEGAGTSEETWGVVIYWEPGEYDNLWNLNNGKQLSEGEVLTIDLGIRLIATQEQFENDSFGSDYDSTAKTDFFPTFVESSSATTTVTPDSDNKIVEAITMQGGQVTATIPAGVLLAEGTTKLTLTVSEMDTTGSNIVLEQNEDMRSLDVHIDGINVDNTVPMIIDLGKVMPTGLNMGNYTLYHVENGATNAMTLVDTPVSHNEYSYDPATGRVEVALATFSELTLVADTVNAWGGTVNISWYIDTDTILYIDNADDMAGLGSLVADGNNFFGKTIRLTNDVNMGGEDYLVDGKLQFYPIGYTAEGYKGAFSGIFDGQGHSVFNIYQNTWMLVGTYDGTYYNAAMGLFGYVYNGTVKNLTIDNFKSEGEFAPTGVVAAYAGGNAVTFENISITNSTPYTYNTFVGGVVGADASDDVATTLNFNNITVDSSNTVGALWGSWDVGAGGILGRLREDGKVNFKNCNVAATIDVYNDVCGNYQYYWYRYCGMFIGTVDKEKEDGSLNLSNITATNCTANFGDRHEYYYCEFEENTQASYTEDFQFSRVDHSELNMNASPVTCTHHHTTNEDKQAVYLPFRQLFGGYGWGIDGTDLDESNAQIGINSFSVTDKEKGETKFATKFVNSDTYLYRVGNLNEITVGTLFDAIEGKTINSSGVYVTVEPLYEEVAVSGTFTANTSDWTQGTIKLTGTGPAKIIIQDYDYCEPTELIVEIVDAKNATAAMDATANNVVLLNDVYGASNINIGNSYTFYGNGFTLTYTGDGSYSSKDLKRGFIEIETGGQLENTRVKCNVFPEAYIYTSEMTAAPYKYQFSAVMISGNSRITNCYIYGARNNICVGAGNVTISDTITECGSLSNIQIDKNSSNAYTVTLNNVTTIQYQVKDPYEGNTMLGVGVMVGTNESSSNANIHLKGTFKQYNWVNADDAAAVSNEMAKAIINAALKENTYIHTVNGKSSANLGIIYLNQLGEEITNDTGLPYISSNISMNVSLNGMNGTAKGRVYALSSAKEDQIVSDPETADKETVNGYYEPQFSFDDDLGGQYVAETTDCDEFCYVEGDTVKVMFLKGETKTLNLAGLVNITKYSGQDLNLVITCVDADGNSVTVTDGKISLAEQKDYTINYTVTDDMFFDQNAGSAENSVTYSWTVPLTVSLKDKGTPNAYFQFEPSEQVIYCSGSSISGYTQFIPFLAGLCIYDYEEGSDAATLRFNGSNTEDGYNKIKSVSINNVNTTGEAPGYHIVTVELNDGGKIVIDMDVRATSGGSTHTGSIKVANSVVYVVNDGTTSVKGQQWRIYSYKFTGNNGVEIDSGAITFGTSGEDAESKTKPTGAFGESEDDGGGCVTPDTLIALADGTQKHIDQVSYTDQLLVWDFFKGEYAVVPSVLIVNHGYGEQTIIKLTFDDGTVVKAITAHSFFDADTNKWELINASNASAYIGHKFVQAEDNGYTTTKLVDVEVYGEYTESYSLVSAFHYNFITENMFSLTNSVHDMLAGLVVGENMSYELDSDVEECGRYTYSEFEDYITYEQYVAFNGDYLKISVEKGHITFDAILALIQKYL